MVNHRNHIFHTFVVEKCLKDKKCATFFMGTLFFIILHTLVLLDHVYSDCLQNVATNTKNKPFSGFGPWPRCCVFVACVHPVAVLNTAFCMTCSLFMLVEDAIGDHTKEAYSRADLITAL